MRHTLLTAMASCMLLLFIQPLFGQTKPKDFDRCGTMQWVEIYNKQHVDPTRMQKETAPTGTRIENYSLAATVYVPVVVHIVLPNPYVVTDADVQAQIDRLNQDFSGYNSDSLNAGVFMGLRGHSKIQFCLAKRTPSGTPTTGIERRASTTLSDLQRTPDPIKRTSLGGLNAWDPTSYLNLWVGGDALGGLLGYAQFPGTGQVADDGVFINYLSWGTNACYTIPEFSKGRTASHEVGHYFGLFHIWGDENSCTGDDFRNLTVVGSTCALPLGLYNPSGDGNTASDIGDTPNQGGPTTTCPSGTVTDGCGSPNGKMYQNHMDYSNDDCLSMFTKKQVSRMEWIIDNCRSGLKTSLGCVPPAGSFTLDASATTVVNPGGSEVIGCDSYMYPSLLLCPGTIRPKLRIGNNGANTITSITIGYTLDGNAPVTQTVAVYILPGNSAVVTFAPVYVAIGVHNIQFFTNNPNGSTDENASNDTISTTFTVQDSHNLPLSEDFESTVFPPAPWSIMNAASDFTWERAGVGKNSTGSLYIDNYNNDGLGTADDFNSPQLNTTAGDSVIISFDLAHKYYDGDPEYWDTLSVMVSSDCGATFTTVFKKWGPALATAGGSDDDYRTPAANDWRNIRIGIGGATVPSGNILVTFRNGGKFGNSIFIDNISIAKKADRDITVESILTPFSFVCNQSFSPKVRVKNVGIENVSSFKVSYSINNGPEQTTVVNAPLPKNESVDVTLPATTINATGINTIKVFSYEPVTPSGFNDLVTSNDTLIQNVTYTGTVSAPLFEQFENASVPPANWGITNKGNNLTWEYYKTDNNHKGTAFINSFNNSRLEIPRNIDELITPVVNFNSGADSLVLAFEVASVIEPGRSKMDTLEVLLTNNCGNSFTSIYKKGGEELQKLTNDKITPGAFVPGENAWRSERINLSSYMTGGAMQVVFRATTNHGKNIFLDNVQLYTRILPSNLKSDGYVIYPNPVANNRFSIWHYETPQDLKSIRVYNSTGQVVYTRVFNHNAEKVIDVDLTGKAPGVYMVQLAYKNESKNISQSIIKQ